LKSYYIVLAGAFYAILVVLNLIVPLSAQRLVRNPSRLFREASIEPDFIGSWVNHIRKR
jgi:hypothetical protein